MRWFDVDKEGLARIVARYGAHRVLIELLSNAFDTSAHRVDVTVSPVKGRPLVEVIVEDDDPRGFACLAHAWTLFAESTRKADPSKRGRFNLGEKLVLSCCKESTIESVSGTVCFDQTGRHEHPRKKRPRGSRFHGILSMTRQELKKAERLVRSLIVGRGVELYYNGAVIPHREPISCFDATLPTEISDREGRLSPSRRKTSINVYQVLEHETPSVYELGIPVVELDGDEPWHIDVDQKVPLTMDRANCKPGFLQQVRVAVLNQMHEQLDEGQAKSRWARAAAGDDRVEAAAVASIKTKRFGNKAVIADHSDPEGTKLAVSKGGSLSAAEWKQFKRHEVVLPAGQVTPSPKAYSKDADHVAEFLDVNEWSEEMAMVCSYTERLAKALIGRGVRVRINTSAQNFVAAWCKGEIHFALRVLKASFFGRAVSSQEGQDRLHELLIHELAHHYSGDHLSERYHNACTRLGAKLARLALQQPNLFT